MKVIRAQVSLRTDSALPEDFVMNTFHFKSPLAADISGTVLTDLTAKISDFYNAVDGLMPAQFLTGVGDITFYDMADPMPRVPLTDATFGFTPNAANPGLPPEVCICLSYKGVYQSGFNNASRRGRIFFGPVSTGVLDVNGTTAKVGASQVGTLETALTALAGTFASDGDDWFWCVYSPTIDGQFSLDLATVAITDGWIDNAFDVQRRRGHASTVREIWVA